MNVYIYQAAFLCEDCGRNTRISITRAGAAPADPDDEESYDSDDFPKGPYENGGGESDTPEHCDHCKVFLENPLTSDGAEYVRTAVTEANDTNLVVREWRDYYSHLFEDNEKEDAMPHGG